jgi:hypothetical protein
LGYVDDLIAATACERVSMEQGCSVGAQERVSAESGCERLGRQVVPSKAHFGVQIEDDGEQCRVFDERGRSVAPERLAPLIASELETHFDGAPVQAECRERVYGILRGSTSDFATDAAGRFWYRVGEEHWVPDGLMTLSLLLKHISRCDKPLSQALDPIASVAEA